MDSRYLRIATAIMAVPVAAHSAEKSVVVIQGKATPNAAGSRTWTLCENGSLSNLGSGAYFRVPSGKYLMITEVVFTVRGGGTRFARAADFKVTMRTGGDAFDLAEVSDRLLAHLENNAVSKRFQPGLMAPSGAEVTGTQKELQPGGGAASLDLTFYGFLVPTGQGW